MLIDGDPLVRQRIDQRDLGRESKVEQMTVSEPVSLSHCGDDGRVCGEIQGWYFG